MFEKSLSGWWWGKTEESKSLLLEILSEHQVSPYYYNLISEHMKKIDIEV